MKNEKICVVGDGLAGLTTAFILSKLNIDIDLYISKKKVKKQDNRITAISDSNYKILTQSDFLFKKKLFWSCNKIHLFNENNNQLSNFLNLNENKKKLMHIFENDKFKKELLKKIKLKKINIRKLSIKNINSEKGYIAIKKSKKYYDLIILCLGARSKIYDSVSSSRKISKDYREVAISGKIKHSLEINNPSQYFLKEGPLAFLPYKKNEFSYVWSLKKIFYENNHKNLRKLVNEKINSLLSTKKILKTSLIQSYPIHLSLRKNYYNNKVLILGEGLHTVHPIAGQGFNLVLRDIIGFYKIIKKSSELGLTISSSHVLKDFNNLRKPENILFGVGIDITNNFFKKNKYFDPFKEVILKNISKYEIVKKFSKIFSDKGISI